MNDQNKLMEKVPYDGKYLYPSILVDSPNPDISLKEAADLF